MDWLIDWWKTNILFYITQGSPIHAKNHPSTHPPIHPSIHAIELVAKTTQMREPRNNEKQTYYSILQGSPIHAKNHPSIHAIELVAKTTQMREPRNNEKQTYYSILYYKVLQSGLVVRNHTDERTKKQWKNTIYTKQWTGFTKQSVPPSQIKTPCPSTCHNKSRTLTAPLVTYHI